MAKGKDLVPAPAAPLANPGAPENQLMKMVSSFPIDGDYLAAGAGAGILAFVCPPAGAVAITAFGVYKLCNLFWPSDPPKPNVAA